MALKERVEELFSTELELISAKLAAETLAEEARGADVTALIAKFQDVIAAKNSALQVHSRFFHQTPLR